jgi:hypothetical protein
MSTLHVSAQPHFGYRQLQVRTSRRVNLPGPAQASDHRNFKRLARTCFQQPGHCAQLQCDKLRHQTLIPRTPEETAPRWTDLAQHLGMATEFAGDGKPG